MNGIAIRFEDPDSWESERENVNNILEKFTGTSDYPATKTFPPIILCPELISEDAINELRALPGVIVVLEDDE